MELIAFLEQLPIYTSASLPPVMCLSGAASYPLLFCSLVRAQVREKTALTSESVDMAASSEADIAGKLTTSFLGERKLYWLGDVAQLDERRQKTFLAWLQSYKGPHTVIFFV